MINEIVKEQTSVSVEFMIAARVKNGESLTMMKLELEIVSNSKLQSQLELVSEFDTMLSSEIELKSSWFESRSYG